MYTKEEILRNAQEAGINFIRLMFTDLFGTVKNVEIPLSQLKKALSNEIMFDGSSIEGFARIQESDMLLYPDLSTWLVFPWGAGEARVARLICDVYHIDGTPFAGDPRSNLRRILKEMEGLGFSRFNLGPEVEFFLFKLDESGLPTRELNDAGGYFDFAPLDLGENCRRDIVIELQKLGYEVEASHHEVAAGQHEIDFKYDEVLAACDKIQTFKLVVKSIARKHGLYATFMPKPIAGINGSGMHSNVSLIKEDGSNAFFDPRGELGLSQVAYHFLGGILKHVRHFCAVTNPTVNSYKRLTAGYEAPVYVAWSPSNRSPLVRVPASRGAGTRLEVRSVDPSANPYLAMAVILSAGLDGIKNEIVPAASVEDNIFAMSRAELEERDIAALPESLKEAVDLFWEDPAMVGALGRHIAEKFSDIKYKEFDEYRLAVHEWELKRYMSLL